jgi:aflatoxin B1 aldehyde reductase
MRPSRMVTAKICWEASESDREFMIDTKWIGEFAPVPQPREISSQLLNHELSLSQVDIFYMHAPDDSVPLSTTLAGVNEAYKKATSPASVSSVTE